MTAPVSIVGAGISGLFFAWRLIESGYPANAVTVFEASGRLGGRIFTATPANGVRVDLGAHNLRLDHPLTARLLAHLGMTGDPARAGAKSDLVHLRDRWRTEAGIRRSYFRRPFEYEVGWNRQRRNPRRLLRRVLARFSEGGRWRDAEALLPEIDRLPLNEAVRLVLSDEEARFLCDRLGYSFFDFPLDARTTLAWLDGNLFGSYAIRHSEGAFALADKLARRLVAKGCGIRTGHRLVAMDIDDNRLWFERDDGSVMNVADTRCVLALPIGRIAAVKGLGEREEICALHRSVEPWPISTGAIWYESAWWTACGFESGRTRTDLPFGSLLHFTSTAEDQATSPGRAAIMFYAEGLKSRAWEDMAARTPCGTWLDTEHSFTRDLHRQIADLYGRGFGISAPQPLGAMLQPWSASESGAAIHLWRHGHDASNIASSATRPLSGVDLSICGESLSLHQGWIEGALKTAEDLLVEQYKLDPFIS